MVDSGVAQRFDLFILTCLRTVFRRATVGRIPLDEWSARRRDLYRKTHNTHNIQTSMPPVGFEPTVSAGERPKTYALDRAATGIGTRKCDKFLFCVLILFMSATWWLNIEVLAPHIVSWRHSVPFVMYLWHLRWFVASTCGCGNGAGSSPRTSVFPCEYRFTNSPYSHS